MDEWSEDMKMSEEEAEGEKKFFRGSH